MIGRGHGNPVLGPVEMEQSLLGPGLTGWRLWHGAAGCAGLIYWKMTPERSDIWTGKGKRVEWGWEEGQME